MMVKSKGIKYDVFLSYNSKDKKSVLIIGNHLKKSDVNPWFDDWNLIPGEPWQKKIQEAILNCKTTAVFLGPNGRGPWHEREMRIALDLQAKDENFRVIPVLLPGAILSSDFITENTWVDFRSGLNDQIALQRLEAGIRGRAPETLVRLKEAKGNLRSQLTSPIADRKVGNLLSSLPESPKLLCPPLKKDVFEKLLNSRTPEPIRISVSSILVTLADHIGCTNSIKINGERYSSSITDVIYKFLQFHIPVTTWIRLIHQHLTSDNLEFDNSTGTKSIAIWKRLIEEYPKTLRRCAAIELAQHSRFASIQIMALSYLFNKCNPAAGDVFVEAFEGCVLRINNVNYWEDYLAIIASIDSTTLHDVITKMSSGSYPPTPLIVLVLWLWNTPKSDEDLICLHKQLQDISDDKKKELVEYADSIIEEVSWKWSGAGPIPVKHERESDEEFDRSVRNRELKKKEFRNKFQISFLLDQNQFLRLHLPYYRLREQPKVGGGFVKALRSIFSFGNTISLGSSERLKDQLMKVLKSNISDEDEIDKAVVGEFNKAIESLDAKSDLSSKADDESSFTAAIQTSLFLGSSEMKSISEDFSNAYKDLRNTGSTSESALSEVIRRLNTFIKLSRENQSET